MSPTSWRRLWTVAKGVITVMILAAVAVVFARNLAALRQYELTLRPGWLALSGVLYLVGLAFCAGYWWWMMRSLGQRPGVLAAIRAYYIGHLGKYVPGKMLVIVMRTALVRGPEVQTSVAAVSAIYETFTSMAAGALLAAVLLAFQFQTGHVPWWQALLALLLAGVPTLPWIFNPIMRRLVAPFRGADAAPLPRIRTPILLGGLVLNLIGWFFQGASLWMAVLAVHPNGFGANQLLDCTAYLGISTVAGFITPVPGGLGVREAFLAELLKPEMGLDNPELDAALATVVALLLRLTWIVSEVLAAGVLYLVPLLWSRKKSSVVSC